MHPDPVIAKVCLVPGLPHLYLAPEKNEGWARLRAAYEALRLELEQTDADVMLIYSTQWLSVIGHLFQTDPAPEWTLVDQNWYEYGSIPYKLRVDADFGNTYAACTRELGMQAGTVAYYGFPVDTGTVIAAKLLNPDNRFPMSMVSCNMYVERDETLRLAQAGRLALERSGKRAIIVLVSGLSSRFFTKPIDPATDHIHSLKDDEWNRKILELLGEGRLEDVAQVARDVARQANGDMGFKGIWWLSGITGQHNRFTGQVYDYAPIWGTGAAVVSLTPSLKETLEKEVDEVTAPATPITPSLPATRVSTAMGSDVPVTSPTPSPPATRASTAMGSDVPATSPTPSPPAPLPTKVGRGGPEGREESNATKFCAAGDIAHAESANDSSLTPPSRPWSGGGLGGRESWESGAGDEAGVGKSADSSARIDSASAPEPVGPYPHARRAGNMLFVSGIGPRQRGNTEIPGVTFGDDGTTVVAHDIRIQTRACIENIKAIIEEAGGTLAHVVDVSAFLTDLEHDFAGFNEVYGEYFAAIGPTRTTVEVERLPTPINVELKVIAVFT